VTQNLLILVQIYNLFYYFFRELLFTYLHFVIFCHVFFSFAVVSYLIIHVFNYATNCPVFVSCVIICAICDLSKYMFFHQSSVLFKTFVCCQIACALFKYACTTVVYMLSWSLEHALFRSIA